MILKVYGLRDTMLSETGLILTERKDELLKRNLRALMLDQRPNPINSNTKDTQVFCLGELDTESGILKSYSSPQFVFALEQIRLDLLEDIRKTKLLAGEKASEEVHLPVEDNGKVEEQHA